VFYLVASSCYLSVCAMLDATVKFKVTVVHHHIFHKFKFILILCLDVTYTFIQLQTKKQCPNKSWHSLVLFFYRNIILLFYFTSKKVGGFLSITPSNYFSYAYLISAHRPRKETAAHNSACNPTTNCFDFLAN
jgi:hypothetical protein